MNKRDYLAELSSAVASYLLTLAAVADCLGKACPEVGSPYRERLSRLRARLSFDPTPEAIKESTRTVEAELKDYAGVALHYLDQHDIELRRAILALEDIIEFMVRRYDFHSSQLQQLASQMEKAEYPTDPERLAEVVALQAGGLRQRIKSMTDETGPMLARMREEMIGVETRLAGAQSTDPSTGLLNRREMTRQIEVYQASGSVFSLLRFELCGAVGEQVMQQAAARLSANFRHPDRIARWDQREFLVLFQVPRGVAEARAAQVAQLLGRYSLDTGVHVEATVKVELTQPELALAPR